MDYPRHALFDSEEVRTQGIHRAKPLQGTLFLQPCHLYFLIPLPSRQSAVSTSSLASSSSHESAQKCCSTHTRKVSFAEAPMEKLDSTQSLKSVGPVESSSSLRESSVQILPSPCEGVVRLKMVVSRRKLSSVLKEGGDCVSMVENLLSPLPQGYQLDAQKGALTSSCDDLISSSSWKPSLESIPESTRCPS